MGGVNTKGWTNNACLAHARQYREFYESEHKRQEGLDYPITVEVQDADESSGDLTISVGRYDGSLVVICE